MTIYPADMVNDNDTIQSSKAVEAVSVGKKYPLQGFQANKRTTAGDFWALKDINVKIERGRVVGIIGRNGAGKTTLLNIIAGVLSPSDGTISVQGKVVGLFQLGIGFQDELSGRENIFLNGAILGAGRREIEDRLEQILEFSELGDFINMPLGSYSQGMRLRLGFSIIANLDFDILVIDEVLAVGDVLFQNKCYERLIDFKRAGKTLIITTQAMEFIERLCDEVILLDHGSLLFDGEVPEGINRYRNLLNTEKFFVGAPQRHKPGLVEHTKKWADNISDWGNKFGGKDIVIEAVEFFDKYGIKTNRINTRGALKIKVSFVVRDMSERPHFGIAIFRKDGVYCYGPNTEFDGYVIPQLSQGKGHFILDYPRFLLASGDYKISIAIWDKNESLAFDHHYGYYDLIVAGPDHKHGELINMPFVTDCSGMGSTLRSLFPGKRDQADIDPGVLSDKFGQVSDGDQFTVEFVKFLDHGGNEKGIFMTNERVKFVIGVNFKKPVYKGLRVWFGIYRDDGIYCQGVTMPFKDSKNYNVLFPRLSLLPGQYCISAGIWDSDKNKFLTYHHGVYPLKMVFDKQDHGTIYMDHTWQLENR